jgi:hypothetical protein
VLVRMLRTVRLLQANRVFWLCYPKKTPRYWKNET